MRRKPKKPSKVSVALQYLAANPGATRYAAAEHAGMKPTSLYAYLKRQKAKGLGVCPTCGANLKEQDK